GDPPAKERERLAHLQFLVGQRGKRLNGVTTSLAEQGNRLGLITLRLFEGVAGVPLVNSFLGCFGQGTLVGERVDQAGDEAEGAAHMVGDRAHAPSFAGTGGMPLLAGTAFQQDDQSIRALREPLDQRARLRILDFGRHRLLLIYPLLITVHAPCSSVYRAPRDMHVCYPAWKDHDDREIMQNRSAPSTAAKRSLPRVAIYAVPLVVVLVIVAVLIAVRTSRSASSGPLATPTFDPRLVLHPQYVPVSGNAGGVTLHGSLYPGYPGRN